MATPDKFERLAPIRTGPGRILIGTSGWMYKHWANGVFYPPKMRQIDWLGFYAERFRTVEINASFYRLPTDQAVAHWQAAAPEDFTYAVKCWRWITHVRKIKETCREDVKTFLTRIEPLWRNLGPILVQLPPSMKADLDRLATFWRMLPGKVGGTMLRVVLEVRHESWLTDQTRLLLDKLGGSLVLHDWAVPTPQTNDAPFVYIRRHGLPAYDGNYTEEQLQSDADMIRELTRQGRDVYVYFNNDAQGYAVCNATRLTEILASGR
jgi:uncharacterized protein YecE (DUF72 family)